MSAAHDKSRKPVLVFRTVSIEKLDGVLRAVRERWPDHTITVLSNAARREELLADTRVSAVITTEPGPRGYAGDPGVRESFAAMVIPIGNRHGGGYANILGVARHIDAAEIHVAAYANELHRLSGFALRRRVWSEFALLALSRPLAWLAARAMLRRLSPMRK